MASVIDGVKVTKLDSVETSVTLNLISARFEENVRGLQAPVDANVKRKLTITNPMTKVRELRESDRSVNESDCSVEVSKLTRDV